MKIKEFRRLKFTPYIPKYDPSRLVYHTIPLTEKTHPRFNAHHTIPRHAHDANNTQASENQHIDVRTHPSSMRNARIIPESPVWENTYKNELNKNEKYDTLHYLQRSTIPTGELVAKFVVTFYYK